jgi:hypothetical protein
MIVRAGNCELEIIISKFQISETAKVVMISFLWAASVIMLYFSGLFVQPQQSNPHYQDTIEHYESTII